MNQFTAFFDANVLYPSTLRSFIMYLMLKNLFRAKWSYMVHTEWIEAVLRTKPDITRKQLERTCDLIDAHATDCLVVNFENLVDGLDLPDKDDRHVLAAAIGSGSQVIVTKNLKDFPADKLKPYDIETQHPDEFIIHLLDLNAGAVVGAAKAHRTSMKNPPKTAQEYLDTLERQELAQTVSILRH